MKAATIHAACESIGLHEKSKKTDMKDFVHVQDASIMGKERTYKYNNSELVIRFGNITESNTDVIVCSDDNLLTATSGASKAVRDACGVLVLHDVQKKADAELGDVVVTTAGKLPHKFLFHCITFYKKKEDNTIPKGEQKNEEYIIQHSISKCLRLLTSLDLTSMALPCIGAGYAGLESDGGSHIGFLTQNKQVISYRDLPLWCQRGYGHDGLYCIL